MIYFLPAEQDRIFEEARFVSDSLRLPKVYTMPQLIAECEKKDLELLTEIRRGVKQWGRWKINNEAPLSIDIGEYQVVLSDVCSLAGFADTVLHLREKSWITHEDIGQFVAAVEDMRRVKVIDNFR